ncbi:MAG: iron hydrogenase small subunit [Bacteroidales bacterium]|nr:iron hydrogenase small subunit [Bacteroidales bacterium]
MSITLKINNKTVKAEKGETILDVASRIGIKIPTLCHIKDLFPSGACRMCVVEMKQNGRLITACSYPVEEGMDILTHSPKVVESRKTIVELLLSNHPDDCLYCIRNKNCELQTLAENLGVNERRLAGAKNEHFVDQSSSSIVRDPAKCILCGRCVRVCEEIENVSAIDFINRGSKTVIGTTFNKGMNVSSCVNCGQCILACPTGALREKTEVEKVRAALANPELKVVVQHAPSISIALGEEFKMKPGQDVAGMMHAAFRRIGFKYVFDTSFTADLTIMEEANELVDRISNKGVLPMFTSCCPAWVKYAEEFHPDILPNISSCKSPQQMMGALIKSYFAEIENIDPAKIFQVSIMPCTAKKFEAAREEMVQHGISDIDAVLTTRELASLFRLYNIDLENLEPEPADSPLGTRSTAGKIFGASGGVMEAAIRTAFHVLEGKDMDDFKVEAVRGFDGIKTATLTVAGMELGVAVVSGLANADKLIKEIKQGRSDIHFIEIMTCPGGCLNGGGQPIGAEEGALKARMKCLYDIDRKETIRTSHGNPQIKEIYSKYLEKPLGEKSHHLLHTHYRRRDNEVLL